jgi:SIR2-like domain
MVVMGAGASYDSAPSMKITAVTANGGFRLPLADNLFDARPEFRPALKAYKQIHPIIPYLRERGTRSLEEVLQEMYENAGNHPERRRQMMALRFYIRDIIYKCSIEWLKEVDGITNHKTLVDQIIEQPTERAIFVTFNYDELIEDALSDLGFRAEYFEDYTTRHVQFALFKLHGSMRWARLLKRSPRVSQAELINQAAGYDPYARDAFRFYNNVHDTTIDDWLAIPAIAIPINSKSHFECPSSHLTNLIQYLPQVDKILAIGWRAKESHFMTLLTTHLRRLRALWVVSKNDANTILRDLVGQLPSKFAPDISTQAFENGFTSFVTGKMGRALFHM